MMADHEIFELAREKCIEWHGDQRRKYTGEPYYTHPFEVADILRGIGADDEVVIAGYLHDVLEDTPVRDSTIRYHFGERVVALVLQVTDVSCPEDGNRSIRKAIDRDHLAEGCADAQTIKLADLISNTRSIVSHDPDFARLYLREKAELLVVLTKGNPDLHARASEIVNAHPRGE